ncbi:MAG: diaminopimelate decarboxylase [Myxococcales bacterium]|nr:diaminopimelate decarboxylase [Myxococcales bacterium]
MTTAIVAEAIAAAKARFGLTGARAAWQGPGPVTTHAHHDVPDHLLLAGNPERFGVRVVDGEVHVEGTSVAAIAEAVDTPCYVYGAAHVRRQFAGLRGALIGRRSLVCYAVKANSSQAILRLLAREGAGADIVSGGELARALAAGFAPSTIVFSGVGKRSDEIDAAITAQIRAIHAESIEEVDRIAARARALGVVAPVALRVNPDIDPDTHPYLATGLRETKFGISMGDAPALARRVIETPGLRLVGLTCHIGSQIMDAEPFLASLERMRALIGELGDAIDLDYLDLGGGLGIPYGVDEPRLDVDAFGAALVAATRDLDMDLLLEPGRYLVGNAGVLLTRVVGHKESGGKRFVIVDAAMNDLIRPALYEAYHAIVPATLPVADAPLVRSDVVGPVCECGDFFARDRLLPWPAVGDLLVILGAGAYGMTMASNYNTRPLAPEVLVSGERFDVTRPRRPVAELIAEERYPAWMADPAT